jgi:hypothetical protein
MDKQTPRQITDEVFNHFRLNELLGGNAEDGPDGSIDLEPTGEVTLDGSWRPEELYRIAEAAREARRRCTGAASPGPPVDPLLALTQLRQFLLGHAGMAPDSAADRLILACNEGFYRIYRQCEALAIRTNAAVDDATRYKVELERLQAAAAAIPPAAMPEESESIKRVREMLGRATPKSAGGIMVAAAEATAAATMMTAAGFTVTTTDAGERGTLVSFYGPEARTPPAPRPTLKIVPSPELTNEQLDRARMDSPPAGGNPPAGAGPSPFFQADDNWISGEF